MNLVTTESTEETVQQTLDAWLQAIEVLSLRRLIATTRLRLEDARQICRELSHVLSSGSSGSSLGGRT
jgi:hypothetical protein